jgi:ferredoxin
MPTITTTDGQNFEVTDGKRLVLALKDNGIDILHRCGGHAKCTTCRVRFEDGEPETMTVAEYDKLAEKEDLLGKVRLSCQIVCEQDMTVEALMRLSTTELDDAGPRPEDTITPDPQWMDGPKG